MKDLSDREREAIRQEVRREFPNDEMMQELHFVRRVHQARTKTLSKSEKIEFYRAGVGQGSASPADGNVR